MGVILHQVTTSIKVEPDKQQWNVLELRLISRVQTLAQVSQD